MKHFIVTFKKPTRSFSFGKILADGTVFINEQLQEEFMSRLIKKKIEELVAAEKELVVHL